MIIRAKVDLFNGENEKKRIERGNGANGYSKDQKEQVEAFSRERREVF